MKPEHLEPARSVIAKLGGVHVVSRATGKSISRVYRWMYPKDRGGTGGLIPQTDAAKLLAHAKANRIRLNAVEFFPSMARVG